MIDSSDDSDYVPIGITEHSLSPPVSPINKKRPRSEVNISSDGFSSSDGNVSSSDSEAPLEDTQDISKILRGLPPLTSPPSTMAFDDTLPHPHQLQPSPEFYTKKFGALACLFHPDAWKVRLMGQLTLSFEFPEECSESEYRATWKDMVKPVKSTTTHTRLYARGTGIRGGVVSGVKTWNKDGEPGLVCC